MNDEENVNQPQPGDETTPPEPPADQPDPSEAPAAPEPASPDAETIPPEPPPPGAPPPPPGYMPEIDAAEVESGKSIALLCYILNLLGIPLWLYPLIARDNEFSLYHSKQCLIMWIVSAVTSVIATILSAVCIGFLIFPALLVFIIIWCVKGIMNVNAGIAAPLPMIGKWGVDLFKGITKTPKV